jgi:lysylphosphatidylglycerol synthetase-like protein (DUF2156 family)
MSITSLIAIPALITLAITILRLVGELEHWPKPWFSTVAGGGLAIVGISWLPIIFGPYFAVKLAGAGDAPSSFGKPIGLALAGLLVLILGGVVAGVSATTKHPNLAVVGFLVMLAAAFVARIGWRSFGNVLLAYGFAARIPVLIVMLIAMLGNGGRGWGTHYDVIPPNFPYHTFASKFFYTALVPQMTLWIGWTVVVGTIFGASAVAIGHRGKQAVPAAV